MHDYFNLESTWKNYDKNDEIKRKVQKIVKVIPGDVETIVDVGCGNGIITNELAGKWDTTALDLSDEALTYVKTKKIKASVTMMPLPDGGFDLVVCSELLEHLNREDLLMAIKEIERISKKYILVTVPNNELLRASYVKCPQCYNRFHAWQHIQSFNRKYLESLFDDEFKTLHFEYFGPIVQKWIPALLTIKNNCGQWFSTGSCLICPSCGNSDFLSNPSNVATKMCNGLNHAFAGKKPYWMLILLGRKKNI
jgi:ubiquinone/menaquinone biosynthesis C-methylase UbiE